MATYTPGLEAAAWIKEVWEPGIAVAAYEEMKIAPHFRKLEAMSGQIHIRKHANLSRSTLGSTTAGSAISVTENTEVEVTKTPQTVYVYTAVSDVTIARMMFDPSDTLRGSIESSIAEGVDVECAKLFTDMTTSVVGNNGVDVTEATFRQGVQKLATNAKQYYKVGQDEPSFIVHANQIDDIMGEPRFTEYQMRGDGSSPLVKGWTLRAHGAAFYETGNIQVTSSTMRNGLLIDDLTMGIGYNQTPTVKMESYLLEKRIIGWVDFAAVTIWEEYGVRYDTKTT
jgi:hypothetical protein